jgi:hypothetical protein
LITALKGRATKFLNGVPKGATYKETREAQEDRLGNQHLAAAYRSQLKTKQERRVSQEFVAAIEQLAHSAYPALPEYHIRREASKAFSDGVEDFYIKILLLLAGQTTANEVLRHAFEMQAILLAARPHKTSARIFWESRSVRTE